MDGRNRQRGARQASGLIIPDPTPGRVVRCGFLWSNEALDGEEKAFKHRPCVIMAAKKDSEGDGYEVLVAPITHSPPRNNKTSLKLPNHEIERLGLIDQDKWVRLDELNTFRWPGKFLKPVPGKGNDVEFGETSKKFYQAILNKMKVAARIKVVHRNEDKPEGPTVQVR